MFDIDNDVVYSLYAFLPRLYHGCKWVGLFIVV